MAERFERRLSSGITLVGDVGGDRHAPTVILMHGGGQTRHSWSGAMDALLRAGYRVINYDSRGHGESGWAEDGDYRLSTRAADLGELLRAMVPQHVSLALVGASLGGATAMWALTEGLRPAAVVLVDIVPRPDPRGVARIRAFMSGNPDGFASLEEVADAIAAYNPHRPRPKDLSGLEKNLRRRPDGRYQWHWDPRILARDAAEELAEFETTVEGLKHVRDVPILLVRGLASDVVNAEGVAELRAAIPDLEIYDVGGAGHMVAGDRNDAFNQGVLEFLARRVPVRTAEER
ncbi:MAG TPA: alpha/beta fold hydrolase [Sphingomonadales bacterium]